MTEEKQIPLFSGRTLFKMKDEQGLPIDFALARVLDSGMAVDWPEFIETARESKWWDFQTMNLLEYVLSEAGGKDYAYQVLQRCKLYILANPHPAMKGVK
jgi:alanyl-tRNA synthetase